MRDLLRYEVAKKQQSAVNDTRDIVAVTIVDYILNECNTDAFRCCTVL